MGEVVEKLVSITNMLNCLRRRFPLSEKLTRCARQMKMNFEIEWRRDVQRRAEAWPVRAWNAVGYADALIGKQVENFGSLPKRFRNILRQFCTEYCGVLGNRSSRTGIVITLSSM